MGQKEPRQAASQPAGSTPLGHVVVEQVVCRQSIRVAIASAHNKSIIFFKQTQISKRHRWFRSAGSDNLLLSHTMLPHATCVCLCVCVLLATLVHHAALDDRVTDFASDCNSASASATESKSESEWSLAHLRSRFVFVTFLIALARRCYQTESQLQPQPQSQPQSPSLSQFQFLFQFSFPVWALSVPPLLRRWLILFIKLLTFCLLRCSQLTRCRRCWLIPLPDIAINSFGGACNGWIYCGLY